MIEYLPFGEKSGQYLHSSKYCPRFPDINAAIFRRAAADLFTKSADEKAWLLSLAQSRIRMDR